MLVEAPGVLVLEGTRGRGILLVGVPQMWSEMEMSYLIKQLRCEICGKFIAYKEFLEGKAINILVNPSAYGSAERFDTYHKACNEDALENDDE